MKTKHAILLVGVFVGTAIASVGGSISNYGEELLELESKKHDYYINLEERKYRMEMTDLVYKYCGTKDGGIYDENGIKCK